MCLSKSTYESAEVSAIDTVHIAAFAQVDSYKPGMKSVYLLPVHIIFSLLMTPIQVYNLYVKLNTYGGIIVVIVLFLSVCHVIALISRSL